MKSSNNDGIQQLNTDNRKMKNLYFHMLNMAFECINSTRSNINQYRI